MKTGGCLFFVRQCLIFVLFVFGLHLATASDVPPAPTDHIYDPDFLISRKVSTPLSEQLESFEAKNQLTVTLAVFTATPRLIEEFAAEFNTAWNETGYGVVIVFSPPRREARVLPSPQLSLADDADRLTQVFLNAAKPALDRGDYSAAANE